MPDSPTAQASPANPPHIPLATEENADRRSPEKENGADRRPRTPLAMEDGADGRPRTADTENSWGQRKSDPSDRPGISEGGTPKGVSEGCKLPLSVSHVSSKGFSSGSNAPSESDEVLWQWEHRTGFRNYDAVSIARIEHAYQGGSCHVRLKSGKMGATPMEIFLIDMVQFDPVTRNHRNIRRVGPDPWWGPYYRFIYSFLKAWETGQPRRVRFHEYRQMSRATVVRLGVRRAGNVEPPLLLSSKSTLASIVKSNWFFPMSVWAVVLNTVYIGVEADHNSTDTLTFESFSWFLLFDNIFCLFFSVELCVRFGAFERKRDCFRDNWFVFDGLLAVLMIGETWVMPLVLAISNPDDSSSGPNMKEYCILRIARLLRLSRLGRIVRLLRVFPEIMTLLKGIAYATRSVFFTLLLLLILLFLFGVIFKTQTEGTALDGQFSSVSVSMWILLLRGTFLDSPATILDEIKEASPMLAAIFLIFIFASSFTVMNMLIGILCDVVHEVGLQEKEKSKMTYLKSALLDLLECFDKDNDRQIHQDEFELLMQNPDLNLILKNFGVDCLDLISLKDVLFEEKDVQDEMWEEEDGSSSVNIGAGRRKLTFDEFVEVVVRLRGGNNATVLDVVELRELICLRFARLEKLYQSDGLCTASQSCLDIRESVPSKPADNHESPTSQKENGKARAAWRRESHGQARTTAWQEQMEQWQEAKHADLLEKICSVQKAQQQQEARLADFMDEIRAFHRGANAMNGSSPSQALCPRCRGPGEPLAKDTSDFDDLLQRGRSGSKDSGSSLGVDGVPRAAQPSLPALPDLPSSPSLS